jgi:ribosomal protein S18 acetylase RimI-like enzyme
MSITVRKAIESDLDSIVRLQLEATSLMRELSPEGFGKALESPPSREQEKNFFLETTKDKDAALLVAEKDSIFAGFALIVVETHSDDHIMAPFATIQYLAVEKSMRHIGVAKALMRVAEHWALSKNISTIDLIVCASNEPAKSLFSEKGFVPLETRMAKRLQK